MLGLLQVFQATLITVPADVLDDAALQVAQVVASDVVPGLYRFALVVVATDLCFVCGHASLLCGFNPSVLIIPPLLAVRVDRAEVGAARTLAGADFHLVVLAQLLDCRNSLCLGSV